MMFKPFNNNKRILIGIAATSIICIVFILITKHKPIADFGNYYYGSKLFIEGKNIDSLYKDIHWFNEQIKLSGEKNFFENYIPVPPFNILFYSPFVFMESQNAKLVFNILSLLLLMISLTRFLKLMPEIKAYYLIVLPIILFPLYNNFLQGQSYLFVTALLMEIYINYLKKRTFIIAFYISIVILLKLFPVFILGYFLFKKEYKIAGLSVLMIIVLTLITSVVVGQNLVINYFTEIVPRLFKNEVIDPFYQGHQSINILLNNLFSFNLLSNPSPLTDMPVIGVVIESVLVSFIIYIAYLTSRTVDTFIAYPAFIFFGILTNKYITSYSLILLLPFAIALFRLKRGKIALLLLFCICNIPLHYFNASVFPLKYFRILFMLGLFVVLIIELKPKINYGLFSIILILLLSTNIFTNKRYPDNYFAGDNLKGIDYDFSILNNKIILKRCLGEIDIIDSIPLNFTVITQRQAQKWDFNKLPMDVRGKQNISKAVILNDSLLLYLSDLQRGVGMTKLRKVKLRI